jgi:hypothetical protein
MKDSRPQTLLVTATKVPLILATQTGVTLPSSRIRARKRWDTVDLLKILVPAFFVIALLAMKAHIAMGAEPVLAQPYGVNIKVPQGWEVAPGTAGVSLLLQEPAPDMQAIEKQAAKTGKPQTTFRRNITVAAIHQPSPIDEQRATELRTELASRFGQGSSVKEFQVTEHKFFNYRGKNDGLVAYTSMLLSDVPVMQMHILVSGAEKQYLLTYTDLAESLTNPANPSFEAAWNSMVSIEVEGAAPQRIDYLKIAQATGGGLGLLIVAFIGFRLLRRSNPIRDAEALYGEGVSSHGGTVAGSDFALGSSLATLPVAWNLNGKNDDGFVSSHASGFSKIGELDDNRRDATFSSPVSTISGF